jgi:hypothetical protein
MHNQTELLMSEDVLEGGCACGAVRYRARGEPIFVNNCHCTLCQRQTGSTSVVNAFYESDRVELLSGELASVTLPAGSGKPHEIVRCAACGSALWSHYPRMGKLGMGIRVGTLDKPGAVRPDAVVHVASKMPWVALPEGIPAFEVYYDAAELLPPDRFARLKTLASMARGQA